MSACASQTRKYDGYSPVLRVFNASFDKVWRAAQISLKAYPMQVNDIEKGVLETDWIRGYEIYKPPIAPKISANGLRYKIMLRTIKGKIDGVEAIKVTVQKAIEKRRDFFAEVEAPPSDGLEEAVILYRIEREITIDNALEASQEEMNSGK